MSNAEANEIFFQEELKPYRELLKEFVGCDAIANYDSTLCWGCGEPKSSACETDCLLERARQLLSET